MSISNGIVHFNSSQRLSNEGHMFLTVFPLINMPKIYKKRALFVSAQDRENSSIWNLYIKAENFGETYYIL